MKPPFLVALAIASLAILAYANTLANGFTNWDDPMLVTENEQVLNFDIVGIVTPRPGHSYQPLRSLSHAIDYRIFGDKPAGHHAINILLHALAAAGLYLLLLQLLPKMWSSQSSRVALVAGLLFAVHPINVEAVAWVASRKYGLLICCTLLAMHYQLRSSQRAAVSCGIFTLLAMLSSPFGVMLPFVLLATDWANRELRSHRPHQVAIAVAALIGYPLVAIGLFGGVGSTSADFALGLLSWPLTMLRVLADYALNLVLPITLNASYPNIVATGLSLKAVLAAVAIGFAIRWAWRADDRLPAWLLIWCGLWWFPVANLLPMSMMMADRYLYLPAIAIFIAIGLLLDRRRSRLVTGCVVCGIALLFLCTATRNSDWRDSRSLWQASVNCDPRNSGAHTSLALALLDLDETALATEHLQKAVLLSPQNYVAHERLGVLLLKAERNVEAREYLQVAIALNPSAGLYGNLGICEHRLGNIEAAIANFANAQELAPEREKYRRNLAIAQLQLGSDLAGAHQFAAAIPHLEAVLASDPGNLQALRNLAACRYQLGNFAAAAAGYRAVLAKEPKDAEAATWLKKSEASQRK
ncbi:MAG: tetratricopeptide (TPR) repeat protein [Rhodothermales bacterium]|jgi:tetratricopeptide (TPR) repeat protein